MGEQIDRSWKERYEDKWMNGWMGGQIDRSQKEKYEDKCGWMGGQIDRQIDRGKKGMRING